MTKELKQEIFSEVESLVESKVEYYPINELKELDRFTHSEYIMDEIMDYFSDEYISSADEDEIFTAILDEMDKRIEREIA